MTEIKDVKVYDLEECMIASGYAMRIEPYNYEYEKEEDKELAKHFNRCSKLVKTSKNTDIHCHDNFLTGIRVSFDIKYPQYLSPEMQRYHFFDLVTSMSKMHKLLKMDLYLSCNQYVTQSTIQYVQGMIHDYEDILNDVDTAPYKIEIKDRVLTTNNKEEALYWQWMKILSNCPLGLELWMRVSTNYKQLQTIYYQRRHHRLKEDWGAIIKMIEGLPYFKEFILADGE